MLRIAAIHARPDKPAGISTSEWTKRTAAMPYASTVASIPTEELAVIDAGRWKNDRQSDGETLTIGICASDDRRSTDARFTYHGADYGHQYRNDPALEAWKRRTFTTQQEYAAAGGYALTLEHDGERSVIDFLNTTATERRALLPRARRTRRTPAKTRQDAPGRKEQPAMSTTTPVIPCPFCNAQHATTATLRDHIVTAHLTASTPLPAPMKEPTPIRKHKPFYDPSVQANPTRAAVLTISPEPRPAPVERTVGIDKSSDTEAVAVWCAERRLPAAVVGTWVWITFDERPDDQTRADLKAAGFWWHQKRRAWVHGCGQRSRYSKTDPRWKYGEVPVSDLLNVGMAAD